MLKEAAASQVLKVPTSINNDEVSTKLGYPNGYTGMAKLNIKEKRKRARDVVATRFH